MSDKTNEKPILFSSPMIRAILSGRKTQTRRICRGPVSNAQRVPSGDYKFHAPMIMHAGSWYIPSEWSPFGRAGDRLWVRETFAPMCRVAVPYCECDESQALKNHYFEYKADTGNRYPGDWPDDESADPECPRWRPSIHMPRAACRLELLIKKVRVERLQQIDDLAVKAEGFEDLESFKSLWDKLNGERVSASGVVQYFGWSDNPWVWVIEFERANRE